MVADLDELTECFFPSTELQTDKFSNFGLVIRETFSRYSTQQLVETKLELKSEVNVRFTIW